LVRSESIIVKDAHIHTVYRSIQKYFSGVIKGFISLIRSYATAIPYVFGLGDLKKEVTEEYPDPISSKTEDDFPSRSRGLLFNDIAKCTGCGECVKICPTRCIKLETEPGSNATKKWVSVFDLDHGDCIFCGFCVDVCAPLSLRHTQDYTRVGKKYSDLKLSFGQGEVTPALREKWQRIREIEEIDFNYGEQ
jgi:formate hydrogenlyase subunit 6/NADH:ubiquinone oxidoreductase subunit I